MSGHGHVTPNADGSKVRCGGPGMCQECSLEFVSLPSNKFSVPLYVGDVPDCTCGPWLGVCPPPPCPVHTFTVPHVVITTPPVKVTTTDGVEWPPLVPVAQGWECPRCKTINAPAAMTCQGRACGQ